MESWRLTIGPRSLTVEAWRLTPWMVFRSVLQIRLTLIKIRIRIKKAGSGYESK
jgi:hypothetical protein